MDELLRLENLTRAYGSFVAFQATQVVLERGAIGLLGPNGAGKSTLMKVLLGLLPPTSGSARLLGLDVGKAAREIRFRVGYLSETDSFVSGLRAVELVALAGEVCGMPRRDAHRRAHEVLSYLGVEEMRYRSTADLPAGIKQRIMLAQALVHDPELLILDEPTNGLDPSGRRAMLALIRSLHRDFGKAVILSSHLLEDVDQVCDAVMIVDRGRVLAHGRIELLRAHRRNRYKLRVVGDVDPLLGRLRAEGVEAQGQPLLASGETVIHLEAPETWRTRRLLEHLAELGSLPTSGPAVALRELVPEEERLADIFHRIVSSAGAAGAAP